MTQSTDDDRDPRLLSGAYALDAVSSDEAAELEAEADASPDVRAAVDQLVETAGLLGLAAAPVQPSSRLKADLMAAIATTPQQAEKETSERTPLDSSTVRSSTASTAASTPPTAMGPAESRAGARWFTRPIGVAVAAVAAIALFVGGGLVGSALTAPPAPDASAAALAEIAAAADSRRASVPIDGGGTATLVWSDELGRSAVLTQGLAEPPSGKTYEAWYIDPSGDAVSAGTFRTSDRTTTLHVLTGSMSAGDAVGVTVEPDGGSDQPTTDPIVVLPSD